MSEPERSTEPSLAESALSTDPAFSAARDLTGVTLGDFHVERRLGRGGMGEVYLATQVSLNRPVALKVLRPEMLANPTHLSRFEAEAWAAAKLNHPNIVHIYTLGGLDGVRFIAMEYVHGTNLREYIDRKGPPDLPLALSIMRQAALAVGAAGEVGLVHRDIKPENLLLTRKGQVKVADFGLCRDKEGQLNLTQPGTTMGTPMYMSPEQVQGHALDHRSDLYSLGVTFYHMLAGVPPFRADTALALALKHVRDEPTSLAVHRPDLPPELVALVMKLLAKDAAGRYQSAAELLRDLAGIRESLHAATGPVSLPDGAVPSSGTAAQTPTADAPAKPRWRPSLGSFRVGPRSIAAACLVGLLLGVGAGWRARARDLLGDGAPEPTGPPALWMAPWEQVPKQAGGAPAQYRYAQLRASEGEREAAWLAVPGRFPEATRWRYQAYTQLARYLFRHRDADRLKALAAALQRGHHEEKKLARVSAAGAAVLKGDIDAALDLFEAVGQPGQGQTAAAKTAQIGGADIGLTTLIIEILQNASSTPAGKEHASSLQALLRSYQQELVIELHDPGGPANPPG